MSSSIAKNPPEDFFPPAEQEVDRGVSAKLLSDSAVNPSQSALQKFMKERPFCGEGGA